MTFIRVIVRTLFMGHAELVAENLALRQQITVLTRGRKRPK
jgi:hypothetical protein